MRQAAAPDLFAVRVRKVVLLGVTPEQLLPNEVEFLRTHTTEEFVSLTTSTDVMEPRSYKHWFYACEHPEGLTVFIAPDANGLTQYRDTLHQTLRHKIRVFARVGGRLARVISLFPYIKYQYLSPT